MIWCSWHDCTHIMMKFTFSAGGQAGSPMPVRPPSGQIDGSSRMTQSPMATQGRFILRF